MDSDGDVVKPLLDEDSSEILDITGPIKLRIKSKFEDAEIEIPNDGCPQNTSVAQLKVLVRKALTKKATETENIQDRYLRLICKGKLLSPDKSFLSEFKIDNHDVVHAVLGAAFANNSSQQQQQPQRQQQQQQQQRRGQRAVQPAGTFRHLLQQHQQRRVRQNPNRGVGTVVGPGGRVTRAPGRENDDSNNSSDDENDPELGRVRERRGFDRLRTAGLSRQEITAIRTYFNRHIDRYIQQQQQQAESSTEGSATTSPSSTLHLDEPDLVRRRLLIEEEWMSTQGAASEFRLNLNQDTLLQFSTLSPNGMSIGGVTPRGGRRTSRARPGSDRDFMWGFFLGFFIGIIGLVWVWMPSIPHKQKLGILTGICFQLILETHNKDFEDGEIFREDQIFVGN